MRIIKRLRYINHYRDRHGRERYYFRRRGEPGVPLPGNPGSPEFMEAYSIALARLRIREIGKDRSVPGTLSAAIGGYYTHNSFLVLSPSTRQARRAVLERLGKAHGDKPLALIERRHIAAMLGKLKPYTAHNWLRALRGLMRFAVEIGLRRDDPTAGIERAKATAGTIHTWSENEIAQYERHGRSVQSRGWQWPCFSIPRSAAVM